jgi:peptidoglycan biosynthesis protein MviN/MurJ (putative lipid II flippase)
MKFPESSASLSAIQISRFSKYRVEGGGGSAEFFINITFTVSCILILVVVKQLLCMEYPSSREVKSDMQ